MSDVNSAQYIIDTLESIDEVREEHGASKPEAIAMLQACADHWYNFHYLTPADIGDNDESMAEFDEGP